MTDHGSESTTREIRVQVQPTWLPEQSDPGQGLWMHAYHVTITNLGQRTVQLLSRHWIITNAFAVEEHVRGPGVVGAQPVLRKGESFEYTSGCPLDTSVGTMHGTYQMIDEEGEHFDIEIAPFTLAEPHSLN